MTTRITPGHQAGCIRTGRVFLIWILCKDNIGGGQRGTMDLGEGGGAATQVPRRPVDEWSSTAGRADVVGDLGATVNTGQLSTSSVTGGSAKGRSHRRLHGPPSCRQCYRTRHCIGSTWWAVPVLGGWPQRLMGGLHGQRSAWGQRPLALTGS